MRDKRRHAVVRLVAVCRFLMTMAAVVLAVLTVVFVVFSVLPSDPIRNALGSNASEESVMLLRRELGYDRPIAGRYAHFIGNTMRLDLGHSIYSRVPVRSLLADATAATGGRSAIALGLSVLLSLALTALAFAARSSLEVVLVSARLLTSVPSIVTAIVIGVITYAASGGDARVGGYLGAVAAIAIYPACSLTEIGVLELRRLQDASYICAARSYGMVRAGIFVRCILPAIATRWVGQISNVAASLIVSATVFEVVFSQPGLGTLLARAVVQNDLPVVQGVAIVVIVAFLMVDTVFERVILPRLGVYRQSAL